MNRDDLRDTLEPPRKAAKMTRCPFEECKNRARFLAIARSRYLIMSTKTSKDILGAMKKKTFCVFHNAYKRLMREVKGGNRQKFRAVSA